MSASRLDAVYRSLLITKFFTKGWGKPENLRRLFEFRKVISNRDECFKLVDRDYPVTITKEETHSDCQLLEGYFDSPLEKCLPGIVPEVAKKAHFQVVLPTQWPDSNCKPVCLHLAGTGDHFFWRRRNLMVKPLLKEAGIGGIILENPFYGTRKPLDQVRSSLHNVSDIFVMGGCLILEALVLFHWCERNGLGPLGVTGLSMGGHMASLAATNWPKPLVLVPCLSWSTASAVFLQGVMARSINWDLLEDQYLSDGAYREKLSKMVTIVDQAFLAGKKFARTFSADIEKVKPATKENDIKKEKSESQDGKLDITYNEGIFTEDQTIIRAGSQNILDHNGKQVKRKSEKVKCENVSAKDNETNMSANSNLNVKVELKRLLDEGKINANLFEKLKSNEKFKLDVNEIAEINKISEDQVKEVLLNTQSGVDNDYEEKKQTNNITKEVVMTDSSIDNVPATIDKNNRPPMVISATKKRSWHVTELTSDIWRSLPFVKQKNMRKIDIAKIHWRDREALQFMRGVMDECTHLSNFTVPYDTSLIIAVCATHDAYVPREDVGALDDIWPGAKVRYVAAGHVSAYLLHQSLFRSCIIESFEKSKKRWKDGKHID